MGTAVVFEENGFPVELYSTREIERAIASGRLRASTIVKTGFEHSQPQTSRAEEVSFLRPLFGLDAPDAPDAAPAAPRPGPAEAQPPVWRSNDPLPPRPPAATVRAAPQPSPFTQAPAARPPGERPPAARAPVSRTPHPRAAVYREPIGLLGCLMPLLRYAEFDGRSSRREFWGFQVLQLIAGFLLVQATEAPALLALGLVALLLPNVAVAVRRMHDQNRSGWLLLLVVIPYVGWLAVVIMLLIEGNIGSNRFGPDPIR